MKTQQIYLSSRNRECGTPNDCSFTFPNGLVKEPLARWNTTVELVEFVIPRSWYDVQTGINDSFSVYRAGDGSTFTVSLAPGWYTVNGDKAANGTDITVSLPQKLSLADNGAVWNLTFDNITGCFTFTTPVSGNGGSYVLDFTANPRTAELLGFDAAKYPSRKVPNQNEIIAAPRPFNLSRCTQLVMHTDLKPAYPQASIDNYGPQYTPMNFSDILAVVPIDVPPKGVITYRAFENINQVTIKDNEVRTLRVFFTDEQETPINLAGCEWCAVFRVTYADNLRT